MTTPKPGSGPVSQGPVVPGVNPEQLTALQAVTRNITAKVRVNYKEDYIAIKFDSDDPQAAKAISGLLTQLATQFSFQLQSFFAITGEIVEVGEPK